MGHFGNYLKAARESENISLEQISLATRISIRVLEALEAERFDAMPGGLFTTSFVRQYANFVGLDEEDAVARLRQVTKPIEIELGELTKPAREQDAGAKIAELFVDFVRDHKMTLTGGFVALALLAGGLSFFQAQEEFEPMLVSQALEDMHKATPAPLQRPAANTPQSTDVASQETQAAALQPQSVAQPGTEAQTPPRTETQFHQTTTLASSSKSIQLELRLTDRAWVRVVADGERVLEDNLEPGFTQTIQADQSVQMVVGNAGALSVELNGEAMPPIGPPGHVRRVDVNSNGMEVVNIEPKPTGHTVSSPSTSETKI